MSTPHKFDIALLRNLPEEYSWYISDYISKESAINPELVDYPDLKTCDITDECFGKHVQSAPKMQLTGSLSESDTAVKESDVLDKVSNQTSSISEMIMNGLMRAFNGTVDGPERGTEEHNDGSSCCSEAYEKGTSGGFIYELVNLLIAEYRTDPASVNQHFDRVKLYAKHLLTDGGYERQEPMSSEPTGSEIIFVPRKRFPELLKKFKKYVLQQGKRCTKEIVDDILRNRDMATVATFFQRYMSVWSRNKADMSPLPKGARAVAAKLAWFFTSDGNFPYSLEPITEAIRKSKKFFRAPTGKSFFALNPYSTEYEIVEVTDLSQGNVLVAIMALHGAYSDLIEAEGNRSKNRSPSIKELQGAVYSNPVFRQLFVIFYTWSIKWHE